MRVNPYDLIREHYDIKKDLVSERFDGKIDEKDFFKWLKDGNRYYYIFDSIFPGLYLKYSCYYKYDIYVNQGDCLYEISISDYILFKGGAFPLIISPMDGVFVNLVNQKNIANGDKLFYIETSEDAYQDYIRNKEIRDNAEKEKLIRKASEKELAEKKEIARKLKEKERRRQLEKEVMQELIDKGEIMPAAGREPIPREIVDAVYTRDGGKCVYCGSNRNLQIDHIIPHSKGGADTLENFQILCQKCNIEKSNKIG